MPFGDIDRLQDVGVFKQFRKSGAGAGAQVAIERSLRDVARARAEESCERIAIGYDVVFFVFTNAHVIAQHLPVAAREQGFNIGFDEFVRFQDIVCICYQM